jgi:hypothetical protein
LTADRGDGAVDTNTHDAHAERVGELDAFSRLRSGGVPMVESRVVTSVDDVVAAGWEFGYPVVVKGFVDGVIHKAAHRLVHLDVRGEREAIQAWTALRSRTVPVGGLIVVQPQLAHVVAELIVATRDDPGYGLHLVVGRGGNGVELDADVAWTRLPLTADRARSLLRRTKIGRRLETKASSMLDDSALPAIIARVAELAGGWRDTVTEIELNPLIVCEHEAWAVDAVITLR